jgi:hypothetical protein
VAGATANVASAYATANQAKDPNTDKTLVLAGFVVVVVVAFVATRRNAA